MIVEVRRKSEMKKKIKKGETRDQIKAGTPFNEKRKRIYYKPCREGVVVAGVAGEFCEVGWGVGVKRTELWNSRQSGWGEREER